MKLNYITVSNQKLEKTGEIHHIRIATYGHTPGKDGTCPCAGECENGCFGKSGRACFKATRNKNLRNWEISKRPDFVALIQAEIDIAKPDFFRIHWLGDFYSREYVEKWVSLVLKNPNIIFYAYTKSVSLLKSVSLPSNLKIRYSFGGTEDKLINIETDAHCKVFETEADLIRAGYVNCHDDDLLCVNAGLRLGIVYHGVKSYANTGWKNVK